MRGQAASFHPETQKRTFRLRILEKIFYLIGEVDPGERGVRYRLGKKNWGKNADHCGGNWASRATWLGLGEAMSP